MRDETGQLHATFPPSSLNNFKRCPGFRNRTEGGEGVRSAERGTRIHKALEKGAIEDLQDEGERHLAQILKDYTDGIIQENLPKLPDIDRKELRLEIDLGGGVTTFGTCDRLLIYKD
jgi:hypothetical protein